MTVTKIPKNEISAPQELSVVGKRLVRPDALDKVTGATKYLYDFKLPNVLVGKVLRSPYAHAKIVRIDKSKAEKLPGVAAVITHDDVSKVRYNSGFTKYKGDPKRVRREVDDRYVISDKARFIGDAVAAVAAVDEETAEQALKFIEVEYQELPAAFTAEDAIKPGASPIHDAAPNNVALHLTYPWGSGDVEKGFEEADEILEITTTTSRQKHCYMEPNSCIARYDSDGHLTVWSPCTQVHLSRRKLSAIFGVPEGNLRIITPMVGGAYGGRSHFNAEPICIALAMKTGKTVKLEYTIKEDFILPLTRQPYRQTNRIGIKKDGTITALQAKLLAKAGAYFETSGPTAGFNMGLTFALYRNGKSHGEADIVYTNTPMTGGFRGYGNPEGMFNLEQLIDMAAEKLGMDPLEFRLKNHRRIGDPSWWPTIPIGSCALEKCIKLGAERFGWKEKKAMKKTGTKRRGVGVALMSHPSTVTGFFMEHSAAFVKLDEDGSATVIVSSTEQGQGTVGILAQIAAEILGIKVEHVRVVMGDTYITMFDMGTYGSRTTVVLGNAVLMAAKECRKQLLERASGTLEVSPENLDIKDERIFVKGQPEKGLSVAEVSRDAIYEYSGKALNICGKYSFNATDPANSYQAAFADVEVDTETGEVKVLKVLVAHDIGRAINPTSVEGQIEGSIAQGIGWALSEDFVVDTNTGKILSDSLETYKLPGTEDMPETEIILVEEPDPSGPFGAKCVGEPCMATIAPAIANAIYDAAGVRTFELPMTPEKILKALKAKQAASAK